MHEFITEDCYEIHAMHCAIQGTYSKDPNNARYAQDKPLNTIFEPFIPRYDSQRSYNPEYFNDLQLFFGLSRLLYQI